jgi:hypothetical protein
VSAVDFGAWARPDLVLTLGSRTYTVPEPSVAAMGDLLALAVRAEVGADAVPPEVQAILDGLPDDGHPALGPVYTQMVADGVGPQTLHRMGVYATLFWARSRQYADAAAEMLWGPERDLAAKEAEGARPKGSRTGRKPTTRPSASASRTTTTRTAPRSTSGTDQSPEKPKASKK